MSLWKQLLNRVIRCMFFGVILSIFPPLINAISIKADNSTTPRMSFDQYAIWLSSFSGSLFVIESFIVHLLCDKWEWLSKFNVLSE